MKESVKAGADIENTANQTATFTNPVSKTVENLKTNTKTSTVFQSPVEMNFTKRLEGRTSKERIRIALVRKTVEVERVKNDAAGKIVQDSLNWS